MWKYLRSHLVKLELLAPWLVLLLLGYYTYLEIEAPYIGFTFSATSGQVDKVITNHSGFDLQTGHELVAVGDMTIDEWQQRLRLRLFPPLRPGDRLDLQVRHEAGVTQVVWPVPGVTPGELADRLINIWWVGVAFWLAGAATLLVVRPIDSRSRLFAAFFLLTALWLVAGNTSRWGHGQSRLVYRTVIWLSLPILLHVHWSFPRPLARLPKLLGWGIYLAGFAMALLQWLERLPVNLYAAAFALTLVASMILLVAHLIGQPDERRQLWLLLIGFGVAILPVVLLSVLSAFGDSTRYGAVAVLFLPMLPGAYFYAVFRYRLGKSELRANGLLTLYLFLVLVGTAAAICAGLLSLLPDFAGQWAFFTTALTLLAALATVYGYAPFARWVERRLLAMPLPPAQLIETYLARITTSLTKNSLVQVLRDEVLPSLLVRQSALFQVQNGAPLLVYAEGLEGAPPKLAGERLVRLQADEVFRPEPGQQDGNWVRLVVPLPLEGRLVGLWLLGRRDPDDHYGPREVALLQALARQTAMALVNIEQAGQLQALYEASIERQEAERTRLAQVLHDQVLNQAAVLYMSLDKASLSERVESTYSQLKQQIRQMISALRPPALDFGLYAALEELAVELDQQVEPGCSVRLEVPPADVFYPPSVEDHLFRIVQLAAENALRHAQARTITLAGVLAPGRVELCVADDGVGFALRQPLNLSELLAHKHFGLVHMYERASYIGADLRIESAAGQGARVCLTWTAPSA